MKTRFIQNYILTLKRELAAFLACCKFPTTKVYYKSELYACSTLKMPVVVFTLSSKGEVVLKCKEYSLVVALDFTIITECSSEPTQGLTLALLITKFLTLNYSLAEFNINDSSVVGDEQIQMVTTLRCSLATRVNSSDLDVSC
ncbi:hypothetical protein [Borrelia sp. RT5S]|uniref:hypothetical protein n=1 Tax=Borrelia sp. RT5S TaxID=2898581 RepID=UPI001E42BF1B|nr:hypothetical protein [Borrelia sp. RT5S]UGQ16722.1 hypothetical protein LSO06_05225 [Borrelia sp. RT5S]